jgi:hypothetical protein
VADLKTRAMLDRSWDFETHTVQSEAEFDFYSKAS